MSRRMKSVSTRRPYIPGHESINPSPAPLTRNWYKTMTSQHRPLIAAAVGLAATVTLVGCTAVQDTLQVGQREFTYADSTEAEESGESFRFQGFLPDDATDVRLIAQLDGRASVMRWTSPTIFTSEHCTNASITSQPEIEAE